MLRLVALVRTDDSEEFSASIIKVTGIGNLGTTLAVTSNGHTQDMKTQFVPHRKHITSLLQSPAS
jgi:hypothetical protein